MEQVEVCNSWEEFDDNAKLLEQELEKLKVQKGRQQIPEDLEPDLHIRELPESSTVPEGAPKMRILKRNVPNNAEAMANNVATSSTNGITIHSGVVIQDESMRTQYVPPEPRISILSRPKPKGAEESSASRNNSSKGKSQAVKTLEQREQEYAEARRRIFGDALETESSEAETST